jgi:hypothetical protein
MKKSKHRPSSRQNRVIQLVRRGHRLHHQIRQLVEQLKPIEDMLRVEALKRPFKHLAPDDPNRDSVEWTARAAGYECLITFPGPYLQKQFPPSHPELPTIRRLCGSRFSQLFTENLLVEITDPPNFEKQVAHLFTPGQGRELIRLCSVLIEGEVIWSDPPAAPTKGRPRTGKPALP